MKRTKKPLPVALSRVGRRLRGRNNGGSVTNVQNKSNWNCHYESPLYNEYILIKIIVERKQKKIYKYIHFSLMWKNFTIRFKNILHL
jgi:hypothetical protein